MLVGERKAKGKEGVEEIERHSHTYCSQRDDRRVVKGNKSKTLSSMDGCVNKAGFSVLHQPNVAIH